MIYTDGKHLGSDPGDRAKLHAVAKNLGLDRKKFVDSQNPCYNISQRQYDKIRNSTNDIEVVSPMKFLQAVSLVNLQKFDISETGVLSKKPDDQNGGSSSEEGELVPGDSDDD